MIGASRSTDLYSGPDLFGAMILPNDLFDKTRAVIRIYAFVVVGTDQSCYPVLHSR
jgi:hypothetical protein